MTQRLNPYEVLPAAMRPMQAVEAAVNASGLEPGLLHLVKLRASQINGCAYCVHLHTREARAAGETEERLHLVSVWPESSLYSAREQAAFAWTEALSLLAKTRAPDDAYVGLTRNFSETEIVNLTLAVATINAWNRLAVGFRMSHPATWRGAD